MNEITKCLVERRSVRKFKNEQIPSEVLDDILMCGTYAPSGMGKQSAKIVVVRDKETIDKIAHINSSIMGRDADPFYGAPTVVIVFADTKMPTYIYDGTCVAMNLLNGAFANGVDSCWIHRAKETFQTEEGKELLKKWNISEDYEGISNIIMGYRDTDLPDPAPRKEDYIVFD